MRMKVVMEFSLETDSNTDPMGFEMARLLESLHSLYTGISLLRGITGSRYLRPAPEDSVEIGVDHTITGR